MDEAHWFKINAARVINDIPMIVRAIPGAHTALDLVISRAWNRRLINRASLHRVGLFA